MNLSNTEITTQNLRMVPLSMEYAKDIFEEFTDDITRYMSPKTPSSINDTKEYINSQIPKIMAGEQFPVVILNKDTKEFLGCGGLHELGTEIPELGIWIKKSAHGHHYGREAVEGLKRWAEENLEYKYLKYPVDRENIPSRKIAESIGGKVEDEYESTTQGGKILYEVEYRIYKKVLI